MPVLMHDTFVDRTTNGEGRVSDFTLAQLQQLDAAAWFSPAHLRTRVPTLGSLLSALQAKQEAGTPKKALLELKGFWTPDEVQIVTDLIADYGVGNLVIMSSFDTSTIDHLSAVDNSLPTAIITRTLPKDPWVVNRMHRAGLGIILYTLNTKAAWKNALSRGVDGIITDLPDHLDRWLVHAASGQ